MVLLCASVCNSRFSARLRMRLCRNEVIRSLRMLSEQIPAIFDVFRVLPHNVHTYTCTPSYSTLRDLLLKCAGTSMQSKLVASHTDFFAKMVVDAVMHLEGDMPLDMIGIKKVQVRGALGKSVCVLGCSKSPGAVIEE